MESKVLVDSSAWIDFFRREDPCFTAISGLITGDAVVTLPLILAELLQGARSAKEMRELRQALQVFPSLQEPKEAWLQAGELAFDLKRQGIHPGLADCFISVLCLHHSVRILSLDKHFQQIRAKTDLRIYNPLYPGV